MSCPWLRFGEDTGPGYTQMKLQTARGPPPGPPYTPKLRHANMWVVLVLAALLPSRRDLVFDHAQRGRYQQAVSLITSARETGAPIAAAEYTVAINACGKAGDVSTALEVLSLLEDDIERSGEPPSSGHAKAFTSAMSACGREARWQTALTLLDRMRGAWSEPGHSRVERGALRVCACG